MTEDRHFKWSSEPLCMSFDKSGNIFFYVITLLYGRQSPMSRTSCSSLFSTDSFFMIQESS